ncbi:MAG: DUF4743 domain-containing protein [Gammaproteobacteria bacterium]|nr:DUF4743 domain-containing protein [Gammaproteobacteria bacterium]
MGYADHIRLCNTGDPGNYIPFEVDGKAVGWVRPVFGRQLAEWPDVVDLRPDRVVLSTSNGSLEQRSQPLAGVLGEMAAQGRVSPLLGELFPVVSSDREQPLLLIDRAAVPNFGIRAFGQHLNAFVRSSEGLKMWIGRRAPDRVRFPGKLDNLVAGGLPWGISLERNLVKECAEEAGIPEKLALEARPTGTVTYIADTERGLKPDTLYCYDLELPETFCPECTDGEMEEFYLWPIEKVMDVVRNSDEFKLNCNLVIIDFLIRYGYIRADEKGYSELVTGLHPALP